MRTAASSARWSTTTVTARHGALSPSGRNHSAAAIQHAGHAADGDGRKLFAVPKKKPEPGDYVARALAAWTKQHVTKDPFEKILREGYSNDEMTNIVLRAAVNPAMTTVATWAAELVQTSNVDFLDRLIPNFIFPQLKAMGIELHVRQQRAC